MTKDEYKTYLTDRKNGILKKLAEYIGTDTMLLAEWQTQLDYVMKELYELDK